MRGVLGGREREVRSEKLVIGAGGTIVSGGICSSAMGDGGFTRPTEKYEMGSRPPCPWALSLISWPPSLLR